MVSFGVAYFTVCCDIVRFLCCFMCEASRREQDQTIFFVVVSVTHGFEIETQAINGGQLVSQKNYNHEKYILCVTFGTDAFPWGAGHGTLRDTRK